MSLRGGEILGIGADNCVSHEEGKPTIVRMDMLLQHSVPTDLSPIKQVLADESRFIVDVYSMLPEEEFQKRYPVAYEDLNQCYARRDRDKKRYLNGKIYFSIHPFLNPIQQLSIGDAQYLRESLALMHSKKVIHGDLHEGNVMRHNGRPVIIDFDSAELNVDGKLADEKAMERIIYIYSRKYLIPGAQSSILVVVNAENGNDLIVQDERGTKYAVKRASLSES